MSRQLKKKKVKFYISEDLIEFIDNLSKLMGVSRSAVLAGMIRYFMANPNRIYSIESLVWDEANR